MPTQQLDRTETAEVNAPVRDLEIRHYSSQRDAEAFRSLNEEWITRYFALEAKDIQTLGDPQGTILRKGGCVLLAYLADEPVGCVALIPMGEGVFELSKMAVSPRVRGRGIGRKLLLRAIEEARAIGAASLFLGSSTRLADAVHLYESVGFRHVPPAELPPMAYARADVFMSLGL